VRRRARFSPVYDGLRVEIVNAEELVRMSRADFELVEALAVLERTPASLKALLEEVPEVWSRATEGEGKWSPYDVIGHLIHGEQTDWMARAHHILKGATGPFEPFDRSAQFKESEGKSLRELLATFAELRARNVEELRALSLRESDLCRTGLHPDFGEVTLRQLLATWVVHDLDHVAQIARTMAKVYAEAVGPWEAYLSILRDRRE
jgi:DinB superfamily